MKVFHKKLFHFKITFNQQYYSSTIETLSSSTFEVPPVIAAKLRSIQYSVPGVNVTTAFVVNGFYVDAVAPTLLILTTPPAAVPLKGSPLEGATPVPYLI